MTYTQIAKTINTMNIQELNSQIKTSSNVIEAINFHSGKLARQIIKTQLWIIDICENRKNQILNTK